jgi:hypothetical protein
MRYADTPEYVVISGHQERAPPSEGGGWGVRISMNEASSLLSRGGEDKAPKVGRQCLRQHTANNDNVRRVTRSCEKVLRYIANNKKTMVVLVHGPRDNKNQYDSRHLSYNILRLCWVRDERGRCPYVVVAVSYYSEVTKCCVVSRLLHAKGFEGVHVVVAFVASVDLLLLILTSCRLHIVNVLRILSL